jgi:hypothetical protein
MAYNFNGTSHYMFASVDGSFPSTPITSLPFTMSCWFRTPSAPRSTSRVLLEIGSSGSSGYRLVIPANQTFIRANHFVSGTAQTADTATNSIVANTWIHCAGVFSSNSSRSVFISTASSATNTQTISAANPSSFSIAVSTAFNVNYFDGDIADIGVWNTALDSNDIASLAKGISCTKVRPNSLVINVPLIRNTNVLFEKWSPELLPNYVQNVGATPSEHPRIYL